MADALLLEALSHRYDTRTALHEVSFVVPEGTLFGLLGPNGGGKTTLFRIISTLLRPSEGQASVFGHDTVADSAHVRRRLGVVFQDPALDDELTVEENLIVHGALYGLTRTQTLARLDALLPRFGLTDRRREKPPTLSGGLRRRVDLVRGLLHRPSLLLLDEPTTGLDPAARRQFWQVLDALRQEEPLTLIVATHLMDEAERCDTLGILDEGRLVALGTPQALTSALGSETLWLETRSEADRLAQQIGDLTGYTVQIAGSMLRVDPGSSAEAGASAVLTRLYEAYGEHLASVTIRRPTLEDVFLAHTGHRLASAASPAHSTESRA